MRHEQFVLALVHPQLPEEQWEELRIEIRGFLEQVRHVQILESYPHPNAVAMFQVRSPVHRDALVLGLPLDYDGVHQVVSTFGDLDWWFDEDPLKGRVLARVWFRDLDSVPQFVVWEQPNVPNGEGPVDPNINLEDAPAWQFGNLQQQGGDGHGWGNWDAAEHNEDFEPPVPVPDEVNVISSSVSSYPAASSYSSVVSLISVSSSENEDLPSVENAIVAQSNDVTTEHLWIMYQRFPQIMFDNMFFKDTSFWSTFSGGAGPSGLSSQVLPVSSLNSDDSSFEEILMPVPLAVVPPTPMTITAPGDQALPSSDLQGPPAFPLEKSNSAKMKKTGNVTPLVTTGLRRSSRLLAINDGHKGVDMMEPDPN
ncbi:hypothetical protein OsI_33032 [Oryza sativa Indica Group]|uniref:DUF7597 domain-containing protein n=1 Tax=Oryza sativa subsp. indica TaxID=39946 RepID=B8BG57_ORYSI|nr:hypothetical protein OsI_33032 [Oryza sativa Indica Group]